MKNKGFTLIELIAVLTIVALIALITVPTITNSISSYKNNLYDTQIKNIESAARVWGSDNMFLLPNSESGECEYSNIDSCPEDYNSLIITLDVLKNNGYIDKDIQNPNTKEPFDDTMKIFIVKKGNSFDYKVMDKDYQSYNIGDTVLVKVNDTESIKFVVLKQSSANDNKITLISETNISESAWCSTCSDNLDGEKDINNKLEETKNSWTNIFSIKVISKDEFNNVVETLNKIGKDKTWLYGNYWTRESDIVDRSKAYYINSTGLTADSIKNSHGVRPVITISKNYLVTEEQKN